MSSEVDTIYFAEENKVKMKWDNSIGGSKSFEYSIYIKFISTDLLTATQEGESLYTFEEKFANYITNNANTKIDIYIKTVDVETKESVQSDIYSFVYKAKNMPPYNLINLVNTGDNASNDISLTWDHAIDPENDEIKYYIYINEEPGGAPNLLLNSSGTTENKYLIPGGTLTGSNSNYTWRVKVVDGSRNIDAPEVTVSTNQTMILK